MFFTDNASIVAFAHGVVFFALGFAVWLQRRRVTRLALTASLIWLASFAFVESLAVWGYAFIPIQQRYLGPGLINVLVVVRTVMQVSAFLFLLEFGLRLTTQSAPLRRAVSAAATLVTLAALASFALVAGARGWSTVDWSNSCVAAMRYGVLLPGGLLAAVGMWRQGAELVAEGMHGIRPYARAAAWVLGIYAIAAGLVVNGAPWAPPGLADDARWLGIAGFPVAAVRAGLGLVLCALAIKLLEIFEVETHQRIDELERARLVAEERARFGRDLHDGTIQSIYAVGLQLESVALRSHEPTVREAVRDVVDQLNHAIAAVRGYVNALHAAPNTPQGVADALEILARQLAAEHRIELRFSATGVADSGILPDDLGHQTEQILREALSNVARHSGSDSVRVRLTFRPDELDLVVEDRGRGVRPDDERPDGRGLRNIRERGRRLGGRVTVSARPGGGTAVLLAVPLDALPQPVTMAPDAASAASALAAHRELEAQP